MLEAGGEIGGDLRYAERARALDRLAEAPYRALMRLHDAQGDRARAVRVYHECVATLEEQLGVQPSPETQALYEALLPRRRRRAENRAARRRSSGAGPSGSG